MEKVVLGLSGGVDSAVCARLLQQQGLEVLGLYMDIAGPSARQDAIDTARFLGVPLHIEDVSAALEENVCRPFTESYLRGETPNPCVLCNPSVKFRLLCGYADAAGAKYIATGHYARTENGGLFKAKSSNDQSYMLCRLRREQVSRLILPLGCFEKEHTRALAEGFGIPVAHKPDSMEICFIPDKDYIGWLSRRAAVPGPGDFIFHGEKLGRHEGIHRYTVGQRRPGLFGGRKLYVSEIRPETNEIVLALWEELFTKTVHARDFSWLVDVPDGPSRGSVKVRHTKWECPECTFTPTPDGGVDIIADTPLRAPAPGQAVVLYSGDRVLGGGFLNSRRGAQHP